MRDSTFSVCAVRVIDKTITRDAFAFRTRLAEVLKYIMLHHG